ncbi:MAG: hypothetical protein AAF266_04935 [Planctomycetota bacterium]
MLAAVPFVLVAVAIFLSPLLVTCRHLLYQSGRGYRSFVPSMLTVILSSSLLVAGKHQLSDHGDRWAEQAAYDFASIGGMQLLGVAFCYAAIALVRPFANLIGLLDAGRTDERHTDEQLPLQE